MSRSIASDSREEESQHEHDVFGVECQEIHNSVKEKKKTVFEASFAKHHISSPRPPSNPSHSTFLRLIGELFNE